MHGLKLEQEVDADLNDDKKTARKPRSGRRIAKGEIHCFACGQSKKAEMFSLNQVHCEDCKRLLDRLSNQCRAQGESQWFADQKRDPKRLRAMLDRYRELVKSATNQGKTTARFSVGDYKEYVKAEKESAGIDRGRKMHEQQARMGRH